MSGEEPPAEESRAAVAATAFDLPSQSAHLDSVKVSAIIEAHAPTADAIIEVDTDDEADSGRFGQRGRPLGRSPFVVGFTGGLGLVLAYSAFLAVRDALSILVLIFIALFLAMGLNPAVNRLQSLGLPRGGAVAAVGLGTILLFCGGLFALVPPLISQGNELINNLPGSIEALKRNQTLSDLNNQYNLIDKLKSAATASNLTTAVGGILGGAQFVFGAYMVGALAIAIVAGTSSFIFLFIAGVAYPFALAVVVAVADLIPQIGATLGAVVVTIVGFATSVPIGVACIIFFVIYQQIENFLIYPKVMRRSVKVSDLAAILAALLGVSLLGVVGALIAIPAVAAIQLIVREVVVPRQEAH
jgi:predicted PurR-regulated permease PerM